MKRFGQDAGVACREWMLLWLLLPCSFSQDVLAAAEERIPPYTIRLWQTDDGLPQNSVFALAQTPDGYLWVGTREGLTRFDGLRFTPVEDSGSPGLKDSWITALCATRDGSLWIATDNNGLARLKAGVFSYLTQADGLPSNQARCLLEGAEGSLWIGTEGGLTRLHNRQLRTFTVREGLADNSVRALCEVRHGTLRVATKRGLSSLEKDGSLTTVSFPGGWNRNALRCVRDDRDGNLWVGSTDGLHCLRGTDRKFYGSGEGLPDRVINTVYEDRAGQLWVGTYGGLARILDGQIVSWPTREDAFGDLVNTIFEDQEGNLWVGARDGLYRLNPARFKTFTTEQGLTGNNAMSVCEDAAAGIWIGVWGGGLNYLRGDKITAYPDTNLQRDSVLSLCQGRDGTLWIGLDFDGGLQVFKEGQRSAYSEAAGSVNAPIRVIHEDRQGALWVGTRAGLSVLREGQFRNYGTTNGLPSDSITAICEDAQGVIWVGTEGGLSRWRGGRFENFPQREGPSPIAVTALYPDAENVLWVGTGREGLYRFRSGRFAAYTTRHGLFSDEIYEILEDDFGCLWMSCRRGLFRVAKKELEELARGERTGVACTAFGKADGLLSVQCNGVAKPAAWKGRDGRLWFPTIRGVIAVDSRIQANDRPPPVYVEDVRAERAGVTREAVGSWRPGIWPTTGTANERDNQAAARVNRERPDGPAVVIAPGRGELEIDYTALSLQAPEKNRFRYLLEGVDSAWVDAGPQRTARYNNLAPGTYRFRVIACNNDGVWNMTGAALTLVLQPHYWQTWWFKAALVAGLGLLLGLAYRARMGRLRELERLRIEIAANLHDDVGARLTKVAMITELVDRQTAEAHQAKPHVRAIAGTMREIIQAMDEIVWTINPKNDTLDHLANYIFQYAQEYFQNTGVRCRLDLPAQLPELAISTKVRHNLFMAVKEALNNVLKHAAAAEVRIALAVQDNRLNLTIADNGKGFDPAAAQHSGNGLENMKQRLAQVRGRFIVQSQPGHGTTVRMDAEAK